MAHPKNFRKKQKNILNKMHSNLIVCEGRIPVPLNMIGKLEFTAKTSLLWGKFNLYAAEFVIFFGIKYLSPCVT
jgi:hypothetical protein